MRVKAMNKLIAKQLAAAGVAVPVLAAALWSSSASAGTGYDMAKVVDVRPVYEVVSFSEPREECRQEQVAYERPQHRRGSATGPLLGAIIGAAIGNAVGHNKTNKKVGVAAGALLGGSIGADIARRNRAYGANEVTYRTEQVCQVVTDYREEERLAGYDVTYRYAGVTQTTRMDRDPGDHIRVRVHVSPAG